MLDCVANVLLALDFRSHFLALDMDKLIPLTREDLRGRPAISYFRYSSPPQGHGSSIERQEEVFGEVLKYFELTVATGFEDRGVSGYKGHNRTRGQLKDLLDKVRDGQIKRGTVLVVEDAHRLSREGVLVVWPMLSNLVQAGIVLITGVNKTIWCEARLNSSENHVLHAAINAALEYSANISFMATKAHRSRRKKMAAGEQIIMNGKAPAWIGRELCPDGTKGGYQLNPHAETVKRIFDAAAQGHSIRAIVDSLNSSDVPLLPGAGTEWRVPRVAAILHDRHVLGLHTPLRRKKGAKPEPLGPESKVYPPVIDSALWDKAQAMLDAKRTLVGRPGGKAVTNLYTGKVFCMTCGAPMRTDTGGGIRRGRRRKDYICSRHIESKTCSDGARYDLHHFEPLIVRSLIQMAKFAPRTSASDDINALDAEIGELRVEIGQHEASIKAIEARVGANPALLESLVRLTAKLDDLRKSGLALDFKRRAAHGKTDRFDDTWRLLRQTVGPAMRGDVEARDRLRGMLAPIKFKIVGNADGGLDVSYEGMVEIINHAGDERDMILDDEDVFE
jgi:DNA invertase Pin-like site-specific DNA recombinase